MFATYLSYLRKELIAVLAGSAGVAMTLLSLAVGGWTLRWIGIAVLMGSFVLANFAVFRSQHQRIRQLEKTIAPQLRIIGGDAPEFTCRAGNGHSRLLRIYNNGSTEAADCKAERV